VLGLAVVASLGIGAVALSPLEVIRALLARIFPASFPNADLSAAAIVWELRLARTLLAGISGAALASAGATFQGVFRNPLADPYVIGVSSGAAFGATCAIAFRLPSPVPFLDSVTVAAFAGALFAAALAAWAARAISSTPLSTSLLLAGTAVGSLLSAFVSLIVSLHEKELHSVFFWLLGGFGGQSWPELGSALIPVAAGFILMCIVARKLDILGTGDEAAEALGLDPVKTRGFAIAAASLATAAAVASGGIIGFVGLIAPHAVRLVLGPGHRRLIPASALAGALLLVLADILARSAAAPLELPIGILTAIIGAPFFLYLLRSRAYSSMGEGQ
jgi:iron complex transport system permease protein